MSVYVGFKIGKARERRAYISEYYCGGCGMPVSDHDSYCPECGGAFRKEDATERTCKPIDEYCCGVPSCGECGVTLNMVVSGVRPFDKVLPNFCHNCGAKVSGDNE